MIPWWWLCPALIAGILFGFWLGSNLAEERRLSRPVDVPDPGPYHE